MNHTGLGKGLGAILGTDVEEEVTVKSSEIDINNVSPDKKQPRKHFDQEKLNALALSIKQHGIIQPILVTKDIKGYKIVAGERRWRAARIAGLKTVPIIEKQFTKQEMAEISLIENIQREDLNPIEEAHGYATLINEYKLTQEQVSEIVGKNRSTIANMVRLLTLEKEIQKLIIDGKISSGHARALLSIENKKTRIQIANDIITKGLNVRNIEKLAIKEKNIKTKEVSEAKLPETEEMEHYLAEYLGTKVCINKGSKGGKIVIEYYNDTDIDRIVEKIYS